jgi:hypothetical protein
MATVIQIKRSTGSANPAISDLAESELAYVQDRSGSGANATLFIESHDGTSAVIHEIGGKYYTDMLAGSTPTPSDFIVGNGATAGASIKLREDSDNGTNFVALKSPDSVGSNLTLTLPSSDGSNGQVLGTDGSGTLSFVSTTSSIAGASDTDISSPASGHILVHDGSDSFDNVAVSGDVTLASNGAMTIGSGVVENGMIAADAINGAKIADDAVDSEHLADNSVQGAHINDGEVSFAKLAAAAVVIESEGIGSNDNDTTIPTSAAVKDYVDTNVTAQDLDFSDGSNTGAVDLDSQSLTIQGTANEIETSASGQTLTVGLPNSVNITSNLTVGGTLNSDDITSTNISIAGNATVTGNLTVQGTTTTVDSTTVSIADPVFEIGDDSSDDNLDRGIKFKYNSGGAKVGFFGMDDSDAKFKFIADATDSSSVFSGTLGNVAFGNVEGAALSLSGSISSYAGAAPTDGQILIGDTSGGVFDAATLTAGEAMTITNGAGAITLAVEDATTSNKGVASFSSDNFTVSSGAVTVTAIDGGTF